jgi:hypothetical protein
VKEQAKYRRRGGQDIDSHGNTIHGTGADRKAGRIHRERGLSIATADGLRPARRHSPTLIIPKRIYIISDSYLSQPFYDRLVGQKTGWSAKKLSKIVKESPLFQLPFRRQPDSPYVKTRLCVREFDQITKQKIVILAFAGDDDKILFISTRSVSPVAVAELGRSS